MRTLYLECSSGISGDMTVAALLDLGASEAVLREGLDSLHVGGYRVETGRANKCGISAFDFNVILEEHGHEHEHGREDHEHGDHGHEDHGRGDHGHGDQGHAHDHGHKHVHDGHDHAHGDAGNGHEHAHEDREHAEHAHHHDARGILEINAIIEGSGIAPAAKALAKRIFRIVAEAEAKAHGLPVEQVHFHEVGAVDSIVDIVAAAICLDNLGIGRVIATPLCEGQGTVRCQHGVLPVPVPAVLEVARAHGVPIQITQNRGEMVTPTGIAILAALEPEFAATGALTIERVGYGAGKKDFDTANLLRASIVRAEAHGDVDTVVKLECNIDDMTGEQLACACEILMEAGALDCWCAPIIMKKGRCAQLLSVLTTPALEEELTRLLFLHTSTIGVRRGEHRRRRMERVLRQIETPYGAVEVKECRFGEICKTAVEYESAKRIAVARGLPLGEVFRAAEAALRDQK